jgi:putative Ca2+/H+ antiporter (TMEM165/GDT1 family)
MLLENILIPLAIVSLAGLGDKTRLTILLLSLKTKNRLSLLLGVLFVQLYWLEDGLLNLFLKF